MTLPSLTPPPTAPSRSDPPATFITRADAFIAWFATHVVEMTALGTAIIAQGAASNYNGTSTTSLAIGTGSKTLTIETGKTLQVGQFVTISSTASPANYMYGQVTSYNSGTGALVVNVSSSFGSGTFAAYSIGLAPAAGGLQLTGGTMTGGFVTTASVAGGAGFNMPHGVAPTAPVNGDLWTTTAGLLFQIGGTTRQAATLDGAETLTNKTLAAPVFTGATGAPVIDVLTPNNGTTGGVRVRGNVTSGKALVQFTDASAANQWGWLESRSDGFLYWSSARVATVSDAQTLTNKTLSGIANTSTVQDPTGTAYGIGYRGIPPRPAASAQLLAVADNGTEIEITSGGITVPPTSSVSLPPDFMCLIFNNSASPQTITQGSGVTLRLAGTTSTGNRTLAPYGLCTIRASATSNLFKISGVGLT